MTRIEADTRIAAPPQAVWQMLVDHERWPEWFRSPDGQVRLDRVELLLGPPDRVGAARLCVATLASVPLLGARELSWTERLADVLHPWLLEFDVTDDRQALKRPRLRIILADGDDGQTRLRFRVTYTPKTVLLRLVDCLYLRRVVARYLQGALANLSERCNACPTELVTDAGEAPAANEAAAAAAPVTEMAA